MVFGSPELFDGIQITMALVSLFAVGETIYVASRYQADAPSINPRGRHPYDGGGHPASLWKPWLRGTVIGFPIGALPAGGAEIPKLSSRAPACRAPGGIRPWRHRRGSGLGGRQQRAGGRRRRVPLLTLGLPTSSTAAILLAAFQNYGLQPGPMLFMNNAQLVWGLIASLYVGKRSTPAGAQPPLVGLWVRSL